MKKELTIEYSGSNILIPFEQICDLVEEISGNLNHYDLRLRVLAILQSLFVSEVNYNRVFDYNAFANTGKSEFARIRSVGKKTLAILVELQDYLLDKIGGASSYDESKLRQDVAELAERLFISNSLYKAYERYLQDMSALNATSVVPYHEFIYASANDFIKTKNNYLKTGKL